MGERERERRGERVRENRGVGVGMREKAKTVISYYHVSVKHPQQVPS